MSKPDDISQEHWDKAFHHMDCHCPEAMMGGDDLQQSVHTAIACAIQEAVMRERIAIAEHADVLADEHDVCAIMAAEEAEVVEHRAAEKALFSFSQAIRNRKE